jgi:hypothetical protein
VNNKYDCLKLHHVGYLKKKINSTRQDDIRTEKPRQEKQVTSLGEHPYGIT